MAKKVKTKKKVKVNKNAKEIRHLQTDLQYVQRAIDGKSEQIDIIFTQQANKIKAEIKKLEENQ